MKTYPTVRVLDTSPKTNEVLVHKDTLLLDIDMKAAMGPVDEGPLKYCSLILNDSANWDIVRDEGGQLLLIASWKNS